MDILKSILFGIVEGITEWLPVSSTGHMILLEEFVKFKNVSPDFFKMFEVVIQLGAILAVVLLYFKDIWPITNNPKRAYAKKGFWSHIDKPIMILWYKIFDNDQKLLLTDDEINKLNVGNDVFLNNLSRMDIRKPPINLL